ncbi:MAG TPA: hypothetical protein VFL17_09635 [Anaerolineae bacterium]|nr:hypothetical protein [Anaerolineae bacterium]
MRWAFHGLIVEGATNDGALRDRWRASFASLTEDSAHDQPDLSFALSLVPSVPSVPAQASQFRQGELLEYYLDRHTAVAHFPRFGQLRLDLARGTTEGRIVPGVLTTYGVFEDLIAIGLSPHLRRRGLFLMHAFAAAAPPLSPLSDGGDDRGGGAVLLVGSIGSGKTTTGMSLLDVGWKLLSNDSPIVNASTEILSYPGLLAAYPDTFARFEATRPLSDIIPESEGLKKLTVAAESIWPDVWIERAPAGAIVFPQIESRMNHAVEPISPLEALRRLLPHAVEQWDREMIPEHLRVLRLLVESAPAYVLRLGPEVNVIPALLVDVLSG